MWIGFLLRHEHGNTLQFASSRKPIGIHLAQEHGIGTDTLDLTYLVIRDGHPLTKSDASLCLTGELKAPWCYLAILKFVPRSLRDGIYDIVARNRLNWFGEQKDCFLPTPVQRLKFLDDLPSHGESTKRAQ